MRTIRFRGFNRKNGVWLYGFYIENRGASFVCPDEPAYGKSWDDYEVEPCTVGQLTGMRDRNGRDIYEGDILRYESGLLVEVRYFHGGFGYSGWFGDILFGGNVNFKFNPADTDERFEIAGNIHDNPEMLKGGGE